VFKYGGHDRDGKHKYYLNLIIIQRFVTNLGVGSEEGAAPPPQHIKHSNYTYFVFNYTVQLSLDVYLWKTIAPSHLEVRQYRFFRYIDIVSVMNEISVIFDIIRSLL